MSKLYRWLALLAALLLLVTAGCWIGDRNQAANKVVAAGDANSTAVKLYFCDQDGQLRVEMRHIAGRHYLPEAALQELLRGPETSELLATLPEGTKLRSLVIENGLARVDFSTELQTEHWGGSLAEMITVYSITNTLTQFPEVERVQILIEGEEVVSLAGHLDLTEPLGANFDLVKE